MLGFEYLNGGVCSLYFICWGLSILFLSFYIFRKLIDTGFGGGPGLFHRGDILIWVFLREVREFMREVREFSVPEGSPGLLGEGEVRDDCSKGEV